LGYGPNWPISLGFRQGSALGYGPNWPIKGPFVCISALFGCTSRSFNSQIALN
jgi:hypothetical protein